jgi:Protein of unknown function (DUF3313)
MIRGAAILAAFATLAACATRPPTQSGFLTTYDGMEAAPDTVRAQINQRRDSAAASAITRVRIAAPVLAPGTSLDPAIGQDEFALVTLELSRQLCFELSRRYAIGAEGDSESTVVEVAISDLARTSPSASVASAVASRVIPGPGSVRLPVGRGGLIVEARATNPQGQEAAAMVWSRGAGVAFDRGSLSEVGDAHRYAGVFAEDFAQWLASDTRPHTAVPEPDPCAQYGARLDLARAAASIGTGLHMVGPASPSAPPPVE